MHVAADLVMHGDVLHTKGKLMNEPEIVYYICCIGFVRNKQPVLNNLASASEWWRVFEMGFNVWREAKFWQGTFLTAWPRASCFTFLCIQGPSSNFMNWKDWTVWWHLVNCQHEILSFLLNNSTQAKVFNDSNQDNSRKDWNFISTTWYGWA